MTNYEPNWGPNGQLVYERTYSRPKPDGTRESWPETVARVIEGNLGYVYGPRDTWTKDVQTEADKLEAMMLDFKLLPAGRHLWATGVKNSGHLMNCWVAPGESLRRHAGFTFMRLMEGGGVGFTYSSKEIGQWATPKRSLRVHVVCSEDHPDYEELRPYLSTDYCPDWDGAYQVGDSREGWAEALDDLLYTYIADDVKHGDRVYDVSNVRPKGAKLKTFGGTASGPLPFALMMLEIAEVINGCAIMDKDEPYYCNGFAGLTPIQVMEIDHAIAQCVVAGGNRRSARMSMMPWDDSHIYEFLACKLDGAKHWTTNISVAIDDRFTELVSLDGDRVRPDDWDDYCMATTVLRVVASGMLTNGEPGLANLSMGNHGEPGTVTSTNPCLTGDTVIATVDGPRTFADLAEDGRDVDVYSWHPETKLPVVRTMRRPHKTRENAEILKVTFDSGLVVRCTPDHSFFTFRGKKVKANKLRPGQSVRAFSASRDGSGHERVHAWDAKRDTAIHQWTHRMIWENEHGPIPEGMVVAHLDHDASNNALENLAVMTPYEHASYDYPLRAAAGFDGTCRNHKVVSVEPDGFADVYNGCVDDSHTYIVLDPEPVAGHMSGIVSANCGEIFLEPAEPCNLGHVNLSAFVDDHGFVDTPALIEAHELMTRFLIRATFTEVSDPESAAILAKNRRIGVGHLGVQAHWAKRGVSFKELAIPFSYGQLCMTDELLELYSVVRQAARDYAFELRIPEPVKLTTVAPTGSVAKLPGTTEGVHPIYARYFEQRIRFSLNDPNQVEQLAELEREGFNIEVDVYDKTGSTMVAVIPTKNSLVQVLEDAGQDPDRVLNSADELTLGEQMAIQSLYQTYWADNAVSFTANIPEGVYSVEQVEDELRKQLPYVKGVTLMVDASRPQAPYTRIDREEYEWYGRSFTDDGIDEECATGACPVR